MHASSLSQVIASELLQRWGLKGFLQHVNAIETFYERRRDLMVAAADKHLTGLCEFSVPEGKQTAAWITNTILNIIYIHTMLLRLLLFNSISLFFYRWNVSLNGHLETLTTYVQCTL